MPPVYGVLLCVIAAVAIAILLTFRQDSEPFEDEPAQDAAPGAQPGAAPEAGPGAPAEPDDAPAPDAESDDAPAPDDAPDPDAEPDDAPAPDDVPAPEPAPEAGAEPEAGQEPAAQPAGADAERAARVADAIGAEFVKQKGGTPSVLQVQDAVARATTGATPQQAVAATLSGGLGRSREEIESVVREFLIQTAKKPTLQQLNTTMDAMIAGAVTPANLTEFVARQVREADGVVEAPGAAGAGAGAGGGPLEAARAPPGPDAVQSEFLAQTGRMPTPAQLASATDAIARGAVLRDNLAAFVAKQVLAAGIAAEKEAGAAPSAAVAEHGASATASVLLHRGVLNEFLRRGGQKPSPAQFDYVLDALQDGADLALVPDLVARVVAGEVDVGPDRYATKNAVPGFEATVKIVAAFREHTGRAPTGAEMEIIRAAVDTEDGAEVAAFIATTFKDIVSEAAGEDAEAARVRSGERALRGPRGAGTEAAEAAAEAAMRTAEAEQRDEAFVARAYLGVLGREPDDETAAFLLTRLKATGDRARVFNLLLTAKELMRRTGMSSARVIFRSMMAGVQDAEAASEAVDEGARRAWFVEKNVHRPTLNNEFDRAFYNSLSEGDRRMVVERHVASHDRRGPSDNYVLRDDVRWDSVGRRSTPCPMCPDAPRENVAQTALIGTLLTDTNQGIGTLAPHFEFREL